MGRLVLKNNTLHMSPINMTGDVALISSEIFLLEII